MNLLSRLACYEDLLFGYSPLCLFFDHHNLFSVELRDNSVPFFFSSRLNPDLLSQFFLNFKELVVVGSRFFFKARSLRLTGLSLS